MSRSCYDKLVSRRRIRVVRPGKGLDHCALVDYASLPDRFKQRFIAIYGDPENMKATIDDALHLDQKARSYFEDEYRLPDGTALKAAQIGEYTLNASVLNRLLSLENTQVAGRHKCGNGSPVNWDAIYGEAERLREEYGHTLPRSVARLRDKMRQYRREGYGCLVSGRLVNVNAVKLTEDAQRWIIAHKMSKVPVYTNAQLLDAFNAVAPSKGWKTITAPTLVNFLKRPEVEIRWKGAVVGDVAAKGLYTRQNATVLPVVRDALWYGDGTRLNLFYKAYVDGRYQVATLYVFEVVDAASEAFLGCHIGTVENFEMMYEAYRSALEFAGRRPYELVYDNQGGTRRKDAAAWLSRIAVCSRPTAPHQAAAKTIESIFGRFQAQVLHRHWNYTGGNITARGEAARINRELIEKNVAQLPTYDEVVATYMAARQEWNAMQHPDRLRWPGRSRMDVYLGTENEKAEPLTDAMLRDLFWVTTPRPATFTAYGLSVTLGGVKRQYEVFDAEGNPDLLWRRGNTGREFYVQYDPHDLSTVRLLTRDQYGDRFEVEAHPYRTVHRALQDQTEDERSFLRLQDERNKIDRIQRQLEADALLREHGLAPDQHGLVDPGLAALNESRRSYERLLDKAQGAPEPAPAEIYPASLGQQEKKDSLRTQYDPAAAIDRL